MSTKSNQKPDTNQRISYQIRIQGHLSQEWNDWFANASITRQEGGETTLICREMDQAALHGLLKKFRDVGITLLEITCLDVGENVQSNGEK
jgi:hypothetical protein